MTVRPLNGPRRRRQRGYALLMVIMGGVILSVLAITLLRGVGINKADFARQTNTVRALYAAESAVAVGVDELREELEANTNPSLVGLSPPSLPGVAFDDYSVAYVDPTDNFAISDIACTYPDDSPCGAGTCSVDNVCRYTRVVTLSEGNYAGLTSQQIPIQVLAAVDIRGAKATVADVVHLNLIPIFQFGVFFDGDMVFIQPPEMDIIGRAHTNGHFIPYQADPTVELDFHEPVTAAGLIRHCMIFDTSVCLALANGTRIMSAASSNFEVLTEGREDQSSDADHASYLETRYGDSARDSTRGVTPLNTPVRTTGTPPAVQGRPDRCGTLANSAAAQSSSIEIIRRPTGGYTYGDAASSGWDVTYGPAPSTTMPTNLSTATWEACTNAGHAHCQQVTRSVPRLSVSEASDDPGAMSERFFWKAHIRIIDGIWYDKDGAVIFDPEDWNLSAVTAVSDPLFERAMRYARVTRYSWFWDPRENRMYGSGNPYQRGQQIRTTDIDVFALKMLLKDSDAVTEIFGADGIPAEGVIVYVSETYDPSMDDAQTTAPSASNVRNFLNFHIMENNDAVSDATECATNAEAPSRGSGLTPCELGFHPYWIWGDGAQTLEGASHYISLGPDPADLRVPDVAMPGADPGTCYNPISLTTPSFAVDAPAPCIHAGASPTGPENAVRLVRATHLPEDTSNLKIGLTVATDNRMYLYGDVNTDTSGNQGLPGKVSVIADSITILSQAFSDRVMQRGAGAGAWVTTATTLSHPGQPAPPHLGGALPNPAGNAPNLCGAWAGVGTVQPRESVDVSINASLLMGDVPDCPGAGTSISQGVSGGGVNNFPRFLEDHAGVRTVEILGSIVSLFRAVQGNSRFVGVSGAAATTASWVAGQTATPYQYGGTFETCIYSAPVRQWSFDTALLDPANLPPGTPRLVQVDRVRWVRR